MGPATLSTRTGPRLRLAASESEPLPAPDLVVERVPGEGGFLIAPCRRHAADWLNAAAGADAIRVDEAVTIADPDEIVTAAVRAGFAVALTFHGQPRLLRGLVAATDVH